MKSIVKHLYKSSPTAYVFLSIHVDDFQQFDSTFKLNGRNSDEILRVWSNFWN